MIKRSLVLLATLVLAGAGCTSTSPDGYSSEAPVTPVAVTSSTETTTPPSTTVSSAPSLDQPQPKTDSSPMPIQEKLAFPGELSAKEVDGKKIRIKTTLGDVVVQLAYAEGPKAASNFYYLVKKGFYDGTIFHRVIPGFMIQGGDPTGTGRGGPGYQFSDDPVKSSYNDGVVAMANAGPNTNGSQFFIMVANVPLPPSYSVFGKVISGLDVAHKIANVSRNGEDRPDQEVKMLSVKIEE